MKILMLLYLKYPDIRVVKEVISLLKENHEVYILASNNGRETEIIKDGTLTIIRPKEWSNNYIWKSLRYFWNSVNFSDNWLRCKVDKIVAEEKIEVIHVHDLRLVKTGAQVAKKYNISIIADLHENYPAAIQAYIADSSLKSVIRRYTVDQYQRWITYERLILQEVDAIITVVEEAKQRLVNSYGIAEKKIYVVSNTEDIESFANIIKDEKIIKKYEADTMISYIGGVDAHRGIETVLKAIPKIIKNIPNFKFIIVGGNNDVYERSLKTLVKKLNIEKYAEFLGRIPFHEVPSYVLASKMGIIPQFASEHSNYTVPHKLFQYLTLGKPVIVSDCKPLKRIVEEGKCGIVFQSNNANDLADKININNLQKLSVNARKIVEEKYKWKNDEVELLKLYEKLDKLKA